MAGVPAAAQRAAEQIDPERIRAAVKYLADDKLEGRGPGTEGDRMAAKYLADKFAAYGLTPAGDSGSWYQKVPLYAVRTVPDKTTFQLVPKDGEPLTLKYGADFVTNNQTGAAIADIDAPIVFVGYGINAPEYNWNDYKGVDVRGKVVLVIVNEPPSEDQRFFKGQGADLLRALDVQVRGGGAAGRDRRADHSSRGPGELSMAGGAELVVGREELPGGRSECETRGGGWIQHDVAHKIAQAAGYDIDDVIDEAGKHSVSRENDMAAEGAHREREALVRFRECGRDGERRRARDRSSRCCTRRTSITWAWTRMRRATTYTTARLTTRRAAAFCWSWRARMRMPRRQGRRRRIACTLPP